jgi:hypothetical protein
VTEIQTARLLLRPWQPDDLAEFTRLLTDPEVTRYIIVHTPFSPQDVAELSDRTLDQWERNGFGPWAAIEKQTGRWAGRIGLDELADWPGRTRSRSAGSCTGRFGAEGLPPRAAAPACAMASRRWAWSGSSASPWPPTPPRGG